MLFTAGRATFTTKIAFQIALRKIVYMCVATQWTEVAKKRKCYFRFFLAKVKPYP